MKEEEFLKDIEELFEECKGIAEQKTKMYGAESIGQLGRKAEFIQIHRKYSRLKQMLWNDEQTVSDTERDALHDTLVDMINYCAIIASCIKREVFTDEEKEQKL